MVRDHIKRHGISILFCCGMVVLATAIVLSTGSKSGLCSGDPTISVCVRNWLAALGAIAIAAIAAIIAYGQYMAADRQAIAAERQAKLTRATIIDTRILSVQTFARFLSTIGPAHDNLKKAVQTLGQAVRTSDDQSLLHDTCGYVDYWSNKVTEAATEFFFDASRVILEEEVAEMFPAVVAAWDQFMAKLSRLLFLAHTISERKDGVEIQSSIREELRQADFKGFAEASDTILAELRRISQDVGLVHHALRDERKKLLDEATDVSALRST